MRFSARITCPRLRALLPSPGGTEDPSVIGYGSTPTSVRRQRRMSRPTCLFPDSAADVPILMEQHPAAMVGKTVIDCRPSILPVSIPFSGLSPETISEARNCVSYQQLEESGRSIMNMDTNEISIDRIVGFAWNDGGTDVEDELPSSGVVLLRQSELDSPSLRSTLPAVISSWVRVQSFRSTQEGSVPGCHHGSYPCPGAIS